MSGRWEWGEPSENPYAIHEGSVETGCTRRGAARWIDCQLPSEEMVQTESDREASEMDETDTLSVSGETLCSRIYESMREVGMHGVRQIGTKKPTKEK